MSWCVTNKNHKFLNIHKVNFKQNLEAGVEKEDLLNDLWVLRNRPVKLRNRIETLQQSKIPVKPWVLRACIESFKTYNLKNNFLK